MASVAKLLDVKPELLILDQKEFMAWKQAWKEEAGRLHAEGDTQSYMALMMKAKDISDWLSEKDRPNPFAPSLVEMATGAAGSSSSGEPLRRRPNVPDLNRPPSNPGLEVPPFTELPAAGPETGERCHTRPRISGAMRLVESFPEVKTAMQKIVRKMVWTGKRCGVDPEDLKQLTVEAVVDADPRILKTLLEILLGGTRAPNPVAKPVPDEATKEAEVARLKAELAGMQAKFAGLEEALAAAKLAGAGQCAAGTDADDG